MMEKTWQQEPETTGHMASTVRKQREPNTGAQLTLSFILDLGTLVSGMVSPTVKAGLPTSI